ncbi:haloacid dehalogenase-like hydrolase [Coralloluteibacterium stylophorae]|uniref:Haloacid dehalogenase-like hydrolase n=1 Tax=Coralloluteibacterium stylophorae TaxID=1776034 RepID=A0A8J7VW41_9GAMM|nr:haloacid dehalogenase-like hydrolase [Coralloluteibacterium stylophorae]MBS7457855.1 haloacid dehalogenase-like hydrolase [Coralloluteibacterium stylophorae]
MSGNETRREAFAGRPPEPGAPLVVFDFDHTLYDGDSGTHLVTWLLKRHAWRWCAALAVSPFIAWLFLIVHLRRIPISVYLWLATIGLHRRRDLDELIDRYVLAHRDLLRERLLPAAVEALHAHRAAGDRVVVVTGAPPELARAILKFAIDEDVPVLGTEVGPRFGAVMATRHCHAGNKLIMLTEAGFGGAIVAAYSDSTADMPLLRTAARPVVVNPKAGSEDAFRRALGADVEIRDWGARR